MESLISVGTQAQASGFSQQSNTHGSLEAFESTLRFGAAELKGNARRIFMAKTVDACGHGGQRWAEERLQWNRGTIRKGQREFRFDEAAVEEFSKRGRKKAEEHLPSLLSDIKAIAAPVSQVDPTFRTTNIYVPLTAKSVRQHLIEEKGYCNDELPSERTISTKLNMLGYRPQIVAKSKPLKKIPQTDAIFQQIHKLNREADEMDGVLRISLDAKARIKVGPFSRKGRSRRHERALDHDFKADTILNLFGFHLPAHDDNYLCFSESKVTADFIVDALEFLWPTLKEVYNPHTLVLNLDNGPENNSRRTQFIKRIVDFSYSCSVVIRLAYYPPYHSKYNPIERVWGVLENHWNGELLDSCEKVLGLASTMTWNGNTPHICIIEGEYPTGVTLSKTEMKEYESRLQRLPELETWFVDIRPPSNLRIDFTSENLG